jgi:3-methyladenine DNA glycosylase/8-oxoguanine DNA glycosylase
VARLEPAALERQQFSRRKAEYLIDLARALDAGELVPADLEDQDAGAARERLGAIRGLGPWSVEYLMMRVLGFEDCVPVGDAGLGAALQRFFGLEERPNERETLRRMEPFVPWRTFATFHMWKSLDAAGSPRRGNGSAARVATAIPGATS